MLHMRSLYGYSCQDHESLRCTNQWRSLHFKGMDLAESLPCLIICGRPPLCGGNHIKVSPSFPRIMVLAMSLAVMTSRASREGDLVNERRGTRGFQYEGDPQHGG